MDIVGIDSGGSKTRVIAGQPSDLSSGSFDSHVFGPGNFRNIGANGVKDLAAGIIERFDLGSPHKVRLIGGLAGASTPESQAAATEAFVSMGFDRQKVTITSDGSLMLAALKNHGVVLISGTGAVCMGRRGGTDIQGSKELYRAGGYGYRLGSEASGYYLGRRALDVALKLEDGRKQTPSVLYEIVRDHFSIDNLQHIASVLYPDPEKQFLVHAKIAALAPAVMGAAVANDKVAGQIVSEAVQSMADYIQAVCRKMGVVNSTVALHGGMFKDSNSPSLILEPLKKHPFLQDLNLSFMTIGVAPDDMDALLEAVRFVIDTESV